MHPEKIYLQECSKGVRFLGAVVTPYSVFPAKRITSKMKNTFVQIESGVFGPPLIRARLNSYLGLLSHM